MGFPVRVILTSSLRYRRHTTGTDNARVEGRNWAVNAAPERAQRSGEAMVSAFNGYLGGDMYRLGASRRGCRWRRYVWPAV